MARKDTLRIAEEAAEWLETLAADGGKENRARFAEWLQASPRHVEEMLIARAMDEEAMRIDPHRRVNVEKLLAEAGVNVIAMPAAQEPLTPSLSHKGRGGLLLKVAGIAALAIALSWVWLITRPQTFTTAIGEQRAVELEDGSIVHLNARSRVTLNLSKQARDVQLVEGEALFKVTHDAARPFRVHVGNTVIRALGTQFNVYRHGSSTTVAVLEGRVEITRESARALSPSELTAGEAVRIPQQGGATRMQADLAEATAWRQRRLIFRDSTLADIAGEFNRYNRTPQIAVEGAVLRARQYGGTFDADDPESLVDFLRPDKNVEIEHAGVNLIIRPRRSNKVKTE